VILFEITLIFYDDLILYNRQVQARLMAAGSGGQPLSELSQTKCDLFGNALQEDYLCCIFRANQVRVTESCCLTFLP
jgi:hypothetical protein